MEFIAQRPKMYFFEIDEGEKETKKIKDVKQLC